MPIKKRMPKGRNFQITPAAIEAFRRMEAIECTCEPIDWSEKYWERAPCSGCDRWWEHHSTLHGELQLKPWHWPAFEYPEEKCPYPAGSGAAEHWQRQRDGSPEAFELYRELVKASKAG
jgi:hypothetical protein